MQRVRNLYIFHRSSGRIWNGMWRLPFNLGSVSGMYLPKCVLSRVWSVIKYVVLFTKFLYVGRLSSREKSCLVAHTKFANETLPPIVLRSRHALELLRIRRSIRMISLKLEENKDRGRKKKEEVSKIYTKRNTFL